MVSGARGNAESGDSAKMYGSAVPPAAPTNLPTPPVTQPVSLLGKLIIFLLLVFFFCPFKFGLDDLKWFVQFHFTRRHLHGCHYGPVVFSKTFSSAHVNLIQKKSIKVISMKEMVICS